MVGLAQVIAAAGLVGIVVWVFGGVVLRVGGWVALTGGLVVVATSGGTGRAWVGLGVAAAGVGAWLVGQLHFTVRHRFHASPLARRLLRARLFRRADPGTKRPFATRAGAATAGALPSTMRTRRRQVGRHRSGVCRPRRRR